MRDLTPNARRRHQTRGAAARVHASRFATSSGIVREEKTRTIIRMCDVDGAEEFFAVLERNCRPSIERPPYHVTLYTIGTLRGIGIATRADLERLGEPIAGAERDALLSVIQ